MATKSSDPAERRRRKAFRRAYAALRARRQEIESDRKRAKKARVARLTNRSFGKA